MDNKYTGTVDVEIAGNTYQLQFNWHALSQIASKYGMDSIGDPFLLPADKVAEIVAIGAGGKITAKEIMDASPPMYKMVAAIDAAFTYAYFGAEEAQKIKDLADAAKKKKTATQ